MIWLMVSKLVGGITGNGFFVNDFKNSIDIILNFTNIRSMNLNLTAIRHHHRHFQLDGAC